VIDERLQSFAQRVEPLAVVDQLGVTKRDVLFVVKRVALDADLFERLWAS